MTLQTPGIHHVTAIASDPGRNLEFYTETLGLRLVKRSVNQDDVSIYHLFYGDSQGSPGTSLTFFPYPGAAAGRTGTGQATAVGLTVPRDAIDYWRDRFETMGVEHDPPFDRLGDRVLPFRDPDGLELELVGTEAPAGSPPEGPVPKEKAIRGFHDVTLTVSEDQGISTLLSGMGYHETAKTSDRIRFETSGDLGAVLDLHVDPGAHRGRQGAGIVHHVAFRVSAEEQARWREFLLDQGLRPTEIIDRKWFKSVYARTGAGVLFEFATETPGYTVDEDQDTLGQALVLPDWLEEKREKIEAELPELKLPSENQ